MTRVVFMGTPEAAVPSLRALDDITTVELVVTRPDRPQGRRRRMAAPPVKEVATTMGLGVVQPANSAELAEIVKVREPPDVGVVVAFGMILRPEVLCWPRHGFLNVHFSLLPRWRGAAPVERAIMAGDTRTGVTIMKMDEGLDTGPMVAHLETPIEQADTGGSLTDRLGGLGADLLARTVPHWVGGKLTALPQAAEGTTYASRIEADDRRLTADMSRTAFLRTVRALAPRPAAQLKIEGEPYKVLEVSPIESGPDPGEWQVSDDHPVLGVADGAVRIVKIQPPGKRAMSGADWLRGRSLPQSIG